jgi:hypothetical protein
MFCFSWIGRTAGIGTVRKCTRTKVAHGVTSELREQDRQLGGTGPGRWVRSASGLLRQLLKEAPP